MWRIWFFFGILEISFGAPVKTNQGDGAPSSELVVLKCLLSSPLNSCDDVKRTVEKIPKRIQKLYEKLKKPLNDVKKNEILDTDALDTIPVSLLYLIPKIRLHSMSGVTASNIVRKYPLDDALTMKILGLLTDDTKIQDFLNGLSKYDDSIFQSDYDSYEDDAAALDIPFISPAVEEEIGTALSKWFPNGSHWEFWLFQASMMSGTPILAYLPNYFLNNLSAKTTEKFLYHLRNWRWDQNYPSVYEDYSSSASLWPRHTMAVRRIWAHVVLTKAEEPGRWSSRILNQLGFLLTGATPDELKNLPASLRLSHNFHMLLHLDWSPLQARSVFDVLYSDLKELNGHDLNNLKNMVVNLLPRQLQHFSENATNFEPIMKSDDKISLATKKQIFHLQLAHRILKNLTADVRPDHWKHKIESLGKFVHLLPPSQLQSLVNETFSLDTLGKIDSSYLTYRQIRYLTKSGSAVEFKPLQEEAVLSLKNFLKSIPSVKLVKTNSNTLLQNIKEHLLMFTSGDSLISTAAILEKVRSNFAEIAFLEKMLYNKDYLQYFNLLGSRDITRKFKDISSNLFILVNKDANLERNIRLLPFNTLFALLSLHRQQAIKHDGGWTYENLIDSSLKMYISGLSCSDIEHLEISDFMPVMGYYVRHRRALGQVFPKNMQYCSQTALVHYLKMKAQLRGIKYDSSNLFHLLESHEVKAVGGYILGGLPADLIVSLPRKQQIISEIGKLTIPELLTTSSVENVKHLANSYYQESVTFQLKAITALGNLVWFLGDENIRRLEVSDFKLFLESQEENSNRALCLTESERNSWSFLLISVYGNPEKWSAGVLRELGDLLIVFDKYEMGRINRTSWIEAADVLAQSTSFFNLVEWPGETKPIYLYEVCLQVLDEAERSSFEVAVKNMLRYYLEATQFLLDTVVSSEQTSRSNEESTLAKNGDLVGKLHFAPSLLDNQRINYNTSVEDFSKTASGTVSKTSESESNAKTAGDNSSDTNNESLRTTSFKAEVTENGNKTDYGSEVEHTTESESSTEFERDKNFSDMIQGDQEFEDGDADDDDDDDYDYENDYPSYDNHHEYDIAEAAENNDPVNEESQILSEAEARERLKRLFLDHLNFFDFFKTKEHSSSQNKESNSKRRRSINSSEGQSPSEERKVSDKSINVYSSQDTKTVEEKKEELRITGSRDLVIEVPSNLTSNLGFSNPSKQPVKITCDAIGMLGKPASLVLDKEDIASMSDTELEDCSEILGSLELERELKKIIWGRLKEWKQSGNLLEVGNLVSVIEEHDLPDITLDLSKPWAYENLFMLSKHISDPYLMSQASDEFLTSNVNLPTLSYEAASALGRLICTMTLAHQKKLLLSQSHVFVNVAPILGSSIECNNKIFESCMYQLAKISTSEEAFGQTGTWDANDVSTLGVIIAGLPTNDLNDGQGNGLKPEALAGLTPSAIHCMSSDSLKVLSEEQLSYVPAMTAASLSENQISSLSSSQLAVLNRVRRQITQEELAEFVNSGTKQISATYALCLSVTVYITYNYLTVRTFF